MRLKEEEGVCRGEEDRGLSPGALQSQEVKEKRRNQPRGLRLLEVGTGAGVQLVVTHLNPSHLHGQGVSAGMPTHVLIITRFLGLA